MYIFPYRFQFSVNNSLFVFRILTQCDKFLIETSHRFRIIHLALCIDLCIIRIDLQPWFTCRKSCILTICPLHRCSGIIAAESGNSFQRFLRCTSCFQSYLVLIQTGNIIYLIDRFKLHILHTKFLSLVDKRKSAKHKVQTAKHFLTCVTAVTFRDISADTTRLVMIFNNIGNKSDIANFSLCCKATFLVGIRSNLFAVIPSLVRCPPDSLFEVKHTGEISIIADEIRNLFILLIENFTDRECIVFLKGAVSHLAKEVADSLCFFQHLPDTAKTVFTIRLIVMHRKCFLDIDNRINTESTKTFIQPPVDILINFFPYFRVLPVQIGLFLMENMQILFICSWKIFPYRSAEIRTPVSWKFSFFLVTQIEEITIFTIRILTCFFKPFMFIRTMVYNKIHQNVHISLLSLSNQFIHICHGSEARINIIII